MKDTLTSRCAADQTEGNAAVSRHGTVLWLPCGMAVGLAAGWTAAVAAQRFAPLVVFPLAVGAALGVVLIGAARLFHVERRQTLLAAALLGSLVAVCAEHYFCYLKAERRINDSQTIQNARLVFAELMRERLPHGPFEYLRREAAVGRPMPFGIIARGPAAWLSWGVDALLLIAASLAVVFFATGGERKCPR